MEDPFGRKLVVYGFISAAVGAFWVRRIIRIDV
jgi:Flp pilus assembly protein TadB